MDRKRRYAWLASVLALVLVTIASVTPAFSIQSPLNSSTGSAVTPPGMVIAARGCEGASSAKTNLQTAIDKLSGVRNESKNLRRALDATRTALEEVKIHLTDKRC